MSYQILRNEWKHQIQKIRQPTAYCQACLAQKCELNDFMLTCAICQSSIHKSHYASQLIGKTINQNHLTPSLQDWKCQRCRYYIERRFQEQVKCEFCPSSRGIMKRVIFEYPLGTRKQIWVHPECTTWCHPIIWMKNKKRAHYYKQIPENPTLKFWFRIDNQPFNKCMLCQDSYGYKIKCSFYSCQRFYHITCAKKLGIVRDLQSMRFDSSDEYSAYCPVYCQEHLQNYIFDFANRIKLYTQKKQNDKVVHFTKLHNSYKIQLKNLHNSAKRAKQEEEMRNQLGKQFFMNNFEQSSISLSISQMKSNQAESSDSESHSSGLLSFLDNRYTLDDIDKFQPSNKTKNQSKKSQKTAWKKNKQYVLKSEIIYEERQIMSLNVKQVEKIQQQVNPQDSQDRIQNIGQRLGHQHEMKEMKQENSDQISYSSYENLSFSFIVNPQQTTLNNSNQQNQMLEEIQQGRSEDQLILK